MSLLKTLDKKVEKIRAEEIQHKAELEEQDKFYNSQLRPVMTRAYEYFSDIVVNLNIVAPDINASYPLNPLAEGGVSLKQSRYKFRFDNRDSPRHLDILCRCSLHKPYTFYLSSQKAVEAHVELLNSFDFSYH